MVFGFLSLLEAIDSHLKAARHLVFEFLVIFVVMHQVSQHQLLGSEHFVEFLHAFEPEFGWQRLVLLFLLFFIILF